MNMTFLQYMAALVITICTVRAAERCCEGLECFNNDFPFKHLSLPRCTDKVKPHFRLYTPQDRNLGEVISREHVPSSFDPNWRTIFLVHGWRSSGQTEWIVNLKNELLARETANVVVLDWSAGAGNLYYPQSASDTRTAGAEMAKMTEVLAHLGTSQSQLWCIGHSLGAHTCGHAGYRFKWSRITGLDPAGPYFEKYDITAGLSPDCADFVDVIHTMGSDGWIMDLGTLKPLGHADFYPNGGAAQPGCFASQDADIRGDVGCSHGRAHEFMVDSINTCVFNTRLICNDEKDLPGSCKECEGVCQTMGFDAEFHTSSHGLFYLQTGSSSPFCLD